MKWIPDRRYRGIGMTFFLVIAASMLFYFLLFRTQSLGTAISAFFSVFNPIIYGFIIAYILMPVMQPMENLFYKVVHRLNKEPSSKLKRSIHIICCFIAALLLALLVYGLIALVLPELIKSIRNIVFNFRTYINNVNKFIDTHLFSNNQELDEKTTSLINEYSEMFYDWIQKEINPILNSLAGGVTNSVVNVVTFIKNAVLGLIISLYIMIRNEMLLARFRRVVYAVFSVETGNRVLHNMRFVDEKFGGFFIGKLLDSAIIGLICYIVCMIMDIPYTILISVVIGLTNIIPFFGPLIGAVPSVILIFVIDPVKALMFIIFIFILQQFDGNFLGPKILGSSVGISSFMVIFSILIGSGFFGVTGMIIAVPLCAVLTAVVQSWLLRRMKDKNLPGELQAYQYVEMINPINGEFIQTMERPDAEASLYDRIKHKSTEAMAFAEPVHELSWELTMAAIEKEDAELNGTAFIHGPVREGEYSIHIKSAPEDLEKRKRGRQGRLEKQEDQQGQDRKEIFGRKARQGKQENRGRGAKQKEQEEQKWQEACKAREAQEVQEAQETREAREAQAAGEVQETRAAQEAGEAGEAQAAQEVRAAEEASEAQEAREAQEAGEAWKARKVRVGRGKRARQVDRRS